MKGLSRNSNSKKDLSCLLPPQQESSGFPCSQPPFERAEERSNPEEMARLNRPSTASGQIPFSSRRGVEQYRTSGLRDALNLEASADALMGGTGNAPNFSGKILEPWQHDKANVSQLLWKSKRENKSDVHGTTASKEDSREERAVGLPKPNPSSCSSAFSNQEKSEPTHRMAALLRVNDTIEANCKLHRALLSEW